ncbi:MAG: 4-hydroxy-tetrahydrodipicolinate synthase [Lachnospiraceae bacterium]|nr:4-hydroxy-tetrahydrodipicolinate synthase [Lachnospiraceae bacterium]
MAIFTGAGVALVTPFKENMEVDYEKLEELVEFQVTGGTDCIVVMGTTGEAATLSHEEHLECIKVVINKVNKRIPVIAGTGSNCTETAVYLSKEAYTYGADGVLVVTPYYNKATQPGLIKHFTEVAKSVDCPVVMYNIPGRTGCTLQPETIAKLVKDVDNIVGVKDATGNISMTAKVMQLTEGNIDLYSGNDDQIVPIMSLGGIGVISVLSNVAPRQTHDICQAMLDGDVKKAAKMQLEALPLIDALFCEVNPIPVKTALNLMGKKVGSMRMPLTDLEPEHTKLLEKAMKDYKIALAE